MSNLEFLRPCVRSMKPYTPGEQPQGASKFIKLNTNENPYPPSPKVLEAIQKTAMGDRLRKYPDPQGTEFRHTAARVLGVSPESILIGNGSDEVLAIILRAIVPEGGIVVTPTPSYVLYQTLAASQGTRVLEVPFEKDWTLNPARLNGTGHLTFLPNPNSPTGTCMPVEPLLNWPTPLVLDEAYADFTNKNGLGLIAKSDRILVTRTLSKSYSLAGIRFGFAIANPDLIAQLVKLKDSYNCDALALAAASAALDDQDYLKEVIAKLLKTRGRMETEFARLGFDVTPSQANFVWCQHKTIPVKGIYQQLKDHGILIRYFNYPNFGEGIRISIGTDAEIDRLLEEMETALKLP